LPKRNGENRTSLGLRGAGRRIARPVSGLLVPLLVVLIIAALSGCNSPAWKNLTTQQKLEDFRYLYRMFKENHGTLAMTKRLFGYDWLAHEKEFEEEIRRTKDDSEFARTIDRILDLTCDAHTWIASPEYWRAYCTLPPFDEIAGNVPEEAVVYWNELASRGLNEYEIFPALYFEGEYVVVTGLDLAGHLVKPGWVVTQVNGTEVDRFVLEQGVGLRYDPVRHKPYVIALGLPASSKVELTFEDGEGNRVVAEVVPSQENWPENYYRPSYYSSEEGTWVHDSLFMTVIPGVAGYMHFWRMPAFNEEDWASVKEFLSSVKDLPALIIDVRCVPGGVATTWKSLVCLLAREPLRYDSYFSPRTGAYVRELFPKYFAAEKPDLEKENPEFARMLPPEVLTEDYGMPVQEWTEIRPSDLSSRSNPRVVRMKSTVGCPTFT